MALHKMSQNWVFEKQRRIEITKCKVEKEEGRKRSISDLQKSTDLNLVEEIMAASKIQSPRTHSRMKDVKNKEGGEGPGIASFW